MEATTQPLSTEQSRVINSGSWGATFGFIYLLAMKANTHALIAFIGSLIPLVNIVVFVYYVLKGKQLAWQFRSWKGFDDFLACQRIWDRWAKWLIGISIALGILGAVVSAIFSSTQ